MSPNAGASPSAAFWAIMGCIWLYTLFVGASATVLRAAVMGTILVLGQRLARPAHAWTTIFAACGAMTLWDLDFQLSVLATASLFPYGKRTEALTASRAAQILALPLILYQFSYLPIEAQVGPAIYGLVRGRY